MSNKFCKRGILLLLCLLFLSAGICTGIFLFKVWQQKTVAFRVSNSEKEMDYDFAAALSYLKYRLEEKGYRVLGINYAGNLYPKNTDKAYVNVYVRGFVPFYDLRCKDDAANVYYLHRMMEVHLEDLRGYDYYLSSQKNVIEYMK